MAKHVLVPVDGSPQAEKAFEHVLDEMADSTVTLLHVINPVNLVAYAADDDDYFDLEGYEAAERRRRADAEEMLERYRSEADERGVTAETVLAVGTPARRILEAAEERSVDHVVMGSRGRSGVGRVLFGSVAETVTRRSPVPVTIVR